MSSDTTTTGRASLTAVWPVLTYRNAPAAMRFLAEALGFETAAVYANDHDPTVVEHAEMRWPLGGGIMLNSTGDGDSPFERQPGNDSLYLVCHDPDALFERATAAGADVVRGVRDEDYGSRGFSVRDPEGNIWSFGTYAGQATDVAAPAIAGDVESFGRLLAEWNEAVVANDPEAIRRFAEPDWVFVGENGIVAGHQFLAAVESGQVTHDFMVSEVHDVRTWGDIAVVIARVRNSGTFERFSFQLDEWSTDVFVRRADGWRCSVTHLTSAATQPVETPPSPGAARV